MQAKRRHIAIIGGGITGLYLARLLRGKRHRVTLYERTARLGGLLGSATFADGTAVDRYYHHIFPHDRELLGLIADLGLTRSLVWARCPLGVAVGHTVHPANSVADLLRFAPLSVAERVRLLALSARMACSPDGERWDGIDAAGLFTAHGGRRAWEQLYLPMMRGKFGPAAAETSAAWVWNKMRQRIFCRVRGGQEHLAAFPASFQVLLDRLTAELQDGGVLLHTDSPVAGIKAGGDGNPVLSLPGGSAEFDAVIVAAPAPELLALLPPDVVRDREPLRRLAERRYLRSECVALRLKRPLSETYFVVSADPTIPFCASIEQTRLYRAELKGGGHLVYVGNYRGTGLPAGEESAEALQRTFFDGLKRLFPDLRDDDVQDAIVSRSGCAQPVHPRGSFATIPGFDLSLRGVFLVEMSQLFPGSRTVNNALRLARRFVQQFDGRHA